MAVVYRGPAGQEVLLGRRKGAHGTGLWNLPGGWIDRTDATIEAAAIREVREETGIQLVWTDRLCEAMTDFPDDGFAGVTLFRIAWVEGHRPEAQLIEPDKCAGWQWFPVDPFAFSEGELFGGVRQALAKVLQAHKHLSLSDIKELENLR